MKKRDESEEKKFALMHTYASRIIARISANGEFFVVANGEFFVVANESSVQEINLAIQSVRL